MNRRVQLASWGVGQITAPRLMMESIQRVEIGGKPASPVFPKHTSTSCPMVSASESELSCSGKLFPDLTTTIRATLAPACSKTPLVADPTKTRTWGFRVAIIGVCQILEPSAAIAVTTGAQATYTNNYL